MQINGDAWAAAFLAREPDCGEFDWLDAHAMVFGRCKPGHTPEQITRAARDAYVREGWNNPKVAAGLDAVLGPAPR